MALSTSLRAAAFAAALALTLLASLSTAAAPAQADNCQPEEVVVRMIPGADPNWQSVFPDENDPRCVIAAQLGCPNQQDPAGCASGILTTVRDGVTREDCAYSPGAANAVAYVVCTVVSKVAPPIGARR